MLSDLAILESLKNICDFFYKYNSSLSKNIIDKATKIINLVEFYKDYNISMSRTILTDIINFIDKINNSIEKIKPNLEVQYA